MKSLVEKPLHILLLLTEKPGEWAAGWIGSILLVLAAGASLLWARATDAAFLGWAVALGLLVFSLADWALLASLPRRGLSFGAPQPPLLGLALIRAVLAGAAGLLGAEWPLPTLTGLALVQTAVWALLAYGTLIEPFRLQTSHVAVESAKLSNPGTPLRLVQLSDLHVERLTRRDRALPGLVAGLRPDLITFTGDFLNTSYNNDSRALADLRDLLARFHAPGGLYAVWGTPEVDYPDFLRPTLEELDIVVLEDRAVEVVVGEHRLWLMGVSCSRDLDADGARLRTLLADAPPGVFTLLLYHTPNLMPQAAALGVDLYLAGHTHGGQWRLPGFGAILTSSRYWKRYEAGPYREGHTQLYVSRGLGLEGFGAPRARLFCPPEVVSLTLTSPRGAE